MSIDFSYLRRAKNCIAQGALTNSKRAESFVLGCYPTHSKKRHGCKIKSVDGKEYIDLICGLGTNLLGWGNNEIADVVYKAYRDGSTCSLGLETEVLFAEKVKEIYPFVDKIKILKTGTEACMAAVKIARAYTKCDNVYSEGYHGWSDDFISMYPPALGIPGRQWMQSVAGAPISIIEPVMTDASLERRKQVEALKGFVIYDEVITGMRFEKHGVANRWGHTPDLICLGKAIGGGLPLAVVGGKTEVMECDEYFVSSTFGGDNVALSAGLKFMELMQTRYDIAELVKIGTKMQGEFNQLWPEKIQMQGYGTRGALTGDSDIKALFMQECALAGILVGPSWFLNFAHRDYMDVLMLSFQQIVSKIKLGTVRLKGEMPVSPFAARVRDGR